MISVAATCDRISPIRRASLLEKCIVVATVWNLPSAYTCFGCPGFVHRALGLTIIQESIPWRHGGKLLDHEIDEGAHLGGGIALGKIYAVDAAEFAGPMIEPDRNERAAAQLIGNDEGWLIDDALPGHRRGQQRIAIVGAQGAGHVDGDLPRSAEDPAIGAYGPRKRVAEAIVLRQFGHFAWRTAGLEIVRRRGDDHAAGRDAARDQARVREVADPDGQIPALLRKIDIAVIEAKLDLQLRMKARKLRQPWRDMTGPERHGHIEPQHPARLETIHRDARVP